MSEKVFKVHTLSNGLTLLGEVTSAVKSAAIGFFVRTGARDELPHEGGVSHFLEHMLFKGTQKRSSMEITYELGNIGAQANAYTTEENTVYYAAILSEYFPQMQELLCDMLRPLLDPTEFGTEKKVILEEIALYEDRPHFYLFEHALTDFFSGHSVGNSVLGSIASVGALTRDQMKAYFDRRYTPGSLVLSACGNFDWDRFVSSAEQYCGSWSGAAAPRETLRYKAKEMYREYRKKDIKQVHVALFTDAACAQDEERYPLTLLSMILGDGTGSRIYWELVDPGLVESAGAECDEHDGTGVFIASASMEPERIDEVSEKLRAIVSTPLNFSEADLERAKTKLASRVVLGGELPMGRMMALGIEWQYRRTLTPLSEVVSRINAITREDIQRALDRFPMDQWAEFRLLPA